MFAKRLTISLCLTCALNISAQDSLLLRDYAFVKRQDPWLTSQNAAALTRYHQANIAEAEVTLTHQRGGLINFNGSPNQLKASAGIESYYRISPRTVLFGSISYDNLSGKDMGGSAFIPWSLISSRQPLPSFGGVGGGSLSLRHFDIIEDSLGNEGTKHLDVYRLSGAFGTDIYNGIAFGARLDYSAANYAKYKDLRHQNKLMDLLATASIYIPLGHLLNVGAHYQYHRNIEHVAFSTYGTNEKTYKSLIDYGNFFGKVEQFGEEGYTDKSREMPLVDEGYGGGLQLELRPLSQLSIYGAFTIAHTTGYYGRKSPYTITYTNHTSDQKTLNARITYEPARSSSDSRSSSSRSSVSRSSVSNLFSMSRQCLDLTLSNHSLDNNANTFLEQKSPTGATYYNYYDPVETGTKKLLLGSLVYTLDLGIRDNLPTWTLLAGTSWMERKQTAFLYPYFRYQKLSSQTYFLSLTHNHILKSGIWSFSLNSSYQKGSGDPYEDGTFQTPSAKQTPPPTMQAYLMQEYHYLTASQYSIGGQVKYAFPFPGTSLLTHIRFTLSHQKANGVDISNCPIGRDRTSGTIAIGCTF